MTENYKPWVGAAYKTGGMLIISESAYCWDEGEAGCPEPDHPTKNTVEKWSFNDFEIRGKKGRYAASITKALSGKERPSLDERKVAWRDVAYSIYVQRRMKNLDDKPTPDDFADSHEVFWNLLRQLRPARVFITSYKTWHQMPIRQVAPTDYWHAYRMKDDSLVWCMKVPHPSGRVEGAGWKTLAWRIQNFRSRDLPMVYTPELGEAKWE